MHTRIYKCAVMRWAHLQMRCANLQMRLHLNCENGRCRPLRRFPRHAAISPRQQGTMRRVSALTFTNAHFAHFYAQKGPFPKPQVIGLTGKCRHYHQELKLNSYGSRYSYGVDLRNNT